jgi:ElaB/YqjD/DUF883 family membrane-anchored ribosome-binding protein
MRKEVPIGSSEAKSTSIDYSSSGSPVSALGLREELANLKEDLDALMLHASTLTESELREARDRMLTRFASMKNVARSFASEATRQLTQGRDATSEFVRNRPFQSVLIAVGTGLLLGVLLRRD